MFTSHFLVMQKHNHRLSKEIPESRWKWMHLYRFHVRAIFQVNSEIPHLWVQPIPKGCELHSTSDHVHWGTPRSLREATLWKECCWSGSKMQQCEAIEGPADEKKACHHAARTLQTTISAQPESRKLMLAQLTGLK